MKEFSSYYYTKIKEIPQTYYVDLGYFEPHKLSIEVLIQKSISPPQEPACRLPKKHTAGNGYE